MAIPMVCLRLGCTDAQFVSTVVFCPQCGEPTRPIEDDTAMCPNEECRAGLASRGEMRGSPRAPLGEDWKFCGYCGTALPKEVQSRLMEKRVAAAKEREADLAQKARLAQ